MGFLKQTNISSTMEGCGEQMPPILPKNPNDTLQVHLKVSKNGIRQKSNKRWYLPQNMP